MANKQLTTNDLVTVFGVTGMTVHNWRKGTPTKTPLPTLKSAAPSVRFSVPGIIAWAKKNDVKILKNPELLDAPGKPTRSGPRPKL